MKQEEVVKLNHKHCGRACLVLLNTGGTVPIRGNGDEKWVAHCKLFCSQKFVFDRSRLNGFHITWACIRRSSCAFTISLQEWGLAPCWSLNDWAIGASKVCEHTRHLLFKKICFWESIFLCVVGGFCVCVTEYWCVVDALLREGSTLFVHTHIT